VIQNQRPDVERTLASLKDFQRDTAEYAFRRLWLDEDQVKRFLVADEVGLGKTMVAKGVIAKTVDHLWDTDKRIDIVYICSNSQIARQNLGRLNVVGGAEHSHADRLTLLPRVIRELRGNRVNFVSFTPGTSFNVGSTGGRADERVLLYWMLAERWGQHVTRPTRWKRFFEGGMDRKNFENWLEWYRPELDPALCRSFGEMVEDPTELGPDGGPLRLELEACVQEFNYLHGRPSNELSSKRTRLVGKLRQLVARAAVHHLEPDLVILDEFQRFKDLLDADDEGAQLAKAIFDHEDAKVLLLSATPFKMYTLPDEPEGDDHYNDFTRTVRFLAGDDRAKVVETNLRVLREAVLAGGDHRGAIEARDAAQKELRRVMCRTERLASTPDRDGMLQEFPLVGTRLTSEDLHAWRTFDDVARLIDRHDVFEYWRATPYPLNLMERSSYQIRKKLQAAVERNDPAVADLLKDGHGLLDWEDIRHYRTIDPGNAKMRGLAEDVLDRGAWRLAWIAPSMPYYEPGGAYAEHGLATFTKRLVFSAWSVVPKSIAVVMSYGSERRAMEAPLKALEAAGKEPRPYGSRVSPPLRFAASEGRLNGMPVLALLYPSVVLARAGDPLEIARELSELPASRTDVQRLVGDRVQRLLTNLPPGEHANTPDQRWYWAAPLLLDRALAAKEHEPFDHYLRAQAPEHGEDSESSLNEHLRAAVSVEDLVLGPRPDDLAEVLADMALAAPGVCALRALSRVTGGSRALTHPEIRWAAFRIAQGLRSLFNKPEIIAVLRSSDDDFYWRSVVEYCLDGNLQSVLDEYAHVLIESEGLQDADRIRRAGAVSDVMVEALSIQAASNVVEQVRVTGGQTELVAQRMTSHFAARYGNTQATDKGAMRESTIRVAYNSPFRPFVLASTSVGQEGLDFHTYSHAVVHWNLPGNPVDLEQREGRVHRYKGHAVRKNVAASHHAVAALDPAASDPWEAVFTSAAGDKGGKSSEITPFWVFTQPGGAVIERYVPTMPLSREVERYRMLQRTVGAYRLVIGQPRQDDLVRYLGTAAGDLSWLRIDLTPPEVTVPFTTRPTIEEPLFDPSTDTPPLKPNPWPATEGEHNQKLMSQVIYNGQLLAINMRQQRGATADEHRQIARNAGYPNAQGVTGSRLESRADGRWVTYAGRKELEESARSLGLTLSQDLSW
jgi:Helicase conserved C-terminal domain